MDPRALQATHFAPINSWAALVQLKTKVGCNPCESKPILLLHLVPQPHPHSLSFIIIDVIIIITLLIQDPTFSFSRGKWGLLFLKLIIIIKDGDVPLRIAHFSYLTQKKSLQQLLNYLSLFFGFEPWPKATWDLCTESQSHHLHPPTYVSLVDLKETLTIIKSFNVIIAHFWTLIFHTHQGKSLMDRVPS